MVTHRAGSLCGILVVTILALILTQVCNSAGLPTTESVFNSSDFQYEWNESPPSLLVPLENGATDLARRTAVVRGLRVEEVKKDVSYEHQGVSVVLADAVATIRLFGDRFTRNTIIRFVTEMGTAGSDCDDLTSTKSFPLHRSEITPHSATADIQLPPLDLGEEAFYLCVRENNTDMPWVHQGTDHWIQMKTHNPVLPLWAQICVVIFLLCLSGLFSGLNLGLMALDRTEIQILINTGTDDEKRYAKAIQPLRDNGNYLLCSLLLGNVLVNSTLTILLDDLTAGILAIVVSTLGIVIFGEIIPQALCSRHGLAVGARTIWITKFFMAVTFPLSYPVSVILDKVLGEEIGNVYNRDRLKELIKVTHDYIDLENDEVDIIEGALEMKEKTVGDVMTKLENAFMLSMDTVLDFDTVSEVMSQGYSRIPVYEGSRSNVVSLLYAKDLAFVDPDDKMPLKTIVEFYNNPCNFVFANTTLDVILREFKQGVRGHMAFVQRMKEGEKGDPHYEVIGLVTMEDVIEALIHAQIYDERDVLDSKPRRRSRAKGGSSRPDLSMIRCKPEGTQVSPQLVFAAFQYLSTSIEQFTEQRISKVILQRMLNQKDLFFEIKAKNREKSDPLNIIYERGKPADYFVLILEGRVQAEMGRENLTFESGPFTYFGTQSLNADVGVGEAQSNNKEQRKLSVQFETRLHFSFVPDYTVRALTDVTFLRISRSTYMAARKATLLEKACVPEDSSGDNAGDIIEEENDQMMGYDSTPQGLDLNGSSMRNCNDINNCSFQVAAVDEVDSGIGQGLQIFADMLLQPSLLTNEFDKEEENPKKKNSFVCQRKVNNVNNMTNSISDFNSRTGSQSPLPPSKASPPSQDIIIDSNNDIEICKL